MEKKQTESEKKWELVKKSYEACQNSGEFRRMYPELSGDWDEDKDFWYEEYCDQMERMKNR